MGDKRTVSLVKAGGDGVEGAVRRAVDLCGGMQGVVARGSRVLIKPNLFEPAPSGSGLITDSRVTEAVAKLVLECGPSSVVIGEGSGVGYDFISDRYPDRSTARCFEASGTADVARRLGVEFLDLNRAPAAEVEVPDAYVMKRVRVARIALESDCIIGVPVLKTHKRTAITFSLKNMKGVLSGTEKRKTHRLGLDKAIVDLNSVVKASFVVADALACAEGLWEPEDRKELGLIMAGCDPVAVDAVGARLMGLDPSNVMHIAYAALKGLGVADLRDIEEVGEAAGTLVPFKTASQAFAARYPEVDLVLGQEACTGCLGEVIGALSYVRNAGQGDALKRLVIQIGGQDEPRADGAPFLPVGRCSRQLSNIRTFVPGCPPSEDTVVKGMCAACNVDFDHVRQCRDQLRAEQWARSAG